MLVMPGGGYAFVCPTEGESIAERFYRQGYNCFVLTYTTDLTMTMPLKRQPLKDLSRAIRFIRAHEDDYKIIPENLAICGFSAGGHLALSSGTLLEKDARPNGMVLCYPVVTATCPTHLGTLHNFCGTENPTDEQKYLFSLDLHVDEHTPPAFIWHTKTDDAVPVQNSINLAAAMEKYGVKHELVLFPEGYHGLSLATGETCKELAENESYPPSAWLDLADNWVKNL